ncbi:hypothetical protein K492DRAFT_161175 [Lichtheimia hyalospora FSU 10163]|nr:hypothetical protein K492DRAFT_161175 [Lichtheimia hyalospora FSU 10163]
MRRQLFLFLRLLLLLFLSTLPLIDAQNSSIAPIANTVFIKPYNYTQCQVSNTFRILDAQRSFNWTTNIYSLNITGRSLISVANLSSTGNLYASAKTEVMLGNSIIYSHLTPLCPDIVGGCPVRSNDTVEIQHEFTLPNTSLPVGDIIVRYSTLTGEMEPWLCLTLAPLEYQHPTWKSIFIYLPVALTVFAAFVSFFASFATVPDTDHDVFLFTSNYAMLPATLRLKTPGFFDLIYHAQFIVLLGQLNLDYPAFYPLFASNFAWSFLLFPTRWIPESATRVLFEMGLANSTRRLDDSPRISVNGTGMNNFAMATGIDINSLFMTSFIVLLMIVAGCLLVCLIIWVMVRCMTWYAPLRYKAQNSKVANFTMGIILRILTLFYLPMMTLSFCQLMLPAPVVILLFAALVLVFHIFLVYGYIAFVLLDVRPPSLVFSDLTLLLRYGSLYNAYTDDHFHFFLYGLIHRIMTGALVGWINIPGLSQILVIFFSEMYFLFQHLIRKPYASRHVNMLHILCGCFRVVIIALTLVYIEPFGIPDVSKQMVAWAQIILHFAMFLLVLFAVPVRNLVVLMTGLADDELYETSSPPARMAWWRRKKRDQSTEQTIRASMRSDDDDYDSSRIRSAPHLSTSDTSRMSLLSNLQSTTAMTTTTPLPKRASEPPPPPPPHQSDIQIHSNGWKTAGKKRHSFFNMNEDPANTLLQEQPSVYQPLITSLHTNSPLPPSPHNNSSQRPSSSTSLPSNSRKGYQPTLAYSIDDP